MSLGATEITLIVIVVILLFGAKRIPELARALGRATTEYKKAKETLETEVNELKNSATQEEKSEGNSSAPKEN